MDEQQEINVTRSNTTADQEGAFVQAEEVDDAAVDPLLAALLSHPALREEPAARRSSSSRYPVKPSSSHNKKPISKKRPQPTIKPAKPISKKRPQPTTPPAKPSSKKRPQQTSHASVVQAESGISHKKPRPTSSTTVIQQEQLDAVAAVSSCSSSSRLPPWHTKDDGLYRKKQFQISKALSWILRHGARIKGLRITPEGLVTLKSLSRISPFNGLTESEFQDICVSDPKQRFFMSTDCQQPPQISIAAYTGHTISGVRGAAVVKVPPAVLTHGSYWECMEGIEREGIDASHRAVHLMDPSAPHCKWRRNLTMQVEVSTSKAMQAGCVFRLAANSVWLCDSSIPPTAITSFAEWVYE
jgi:2'-phosphotransferase